jgi:dephospho-CoA kinase
MSAAGPTRRVIGLTGGVATGKSTVAGLLRARGVPVIDADQVSREVTAPGSPGLAEVVAAFGPSVLTPEGTLDRKALGAIVFADPTARARLEAISHPRIGAAIADWIGAQQGPCVVEAALMVETGTWRRYDDLVVVSCPPDLQRRRLMAREAIDGAEADRRLAAQLPLIQKEALASVLVWNDGDAGQLEAAVDAAWARLLAAPPRGPSSPQ